LLREGLEAMLIIGALASFLRKSGRQNDVKTLYFGAITGVILSLLAGVVLLKVLAHSGAYKLVLEGVSLMLAALMLFWVGNWLLARRHAMQWQTYVRDQLNTAGNSTLAMAGVAMLAVFREGAETVLFMVAIASAPTASGNGVLAGIVLAVATLALCFYLLRALALSIPLKLFFSVSAALLLFLGFTFTGHGIAALQLASWVGSHPQLTWPTLATLGVFPTVEGYAAQGFYLGLLLVLFIKSQKLNLRYGKLRALLHKSI
jgi:high-affinity iron transporter